PALLAQESLADASLEELLQVRVTSVSKKEQTLARTAASVYVIGPEEIRRSGAETLPDLLRWVPGVDVEQIDANAWAISIRGFNSRYSNKVLVMIDGRTVYTNTFGGVFWDQVDLPLEDIERVEVIRGPGGTVWGANAVNGVIQIFTRSARATQGALVSQTAGDQGSYRSLVRYGGAAGAHGFYRGFATWQRFNDLDSLGGAEAGDGWTRSQAGFRGDWQSAGGDVFTAQGEYFRNRGHQNRRSLFMDLPGAATFNEPVDSEGGNLLFRWSRSSRGGAQTTFQAYFDDYHRYDLGTDEDYRAGDFDIEHHFRAGDRHDLVAAAGYRIIRTAYRGSSTIAIDPAQRVDQLSSAFLQDEIRLGDRVWLTAGSKVEHNSYTGFEFEPSLRLAWAPSARHTLWASAARAIRQPTRVEFGIQLDMGVVATRPGMEIGMTLSGNPDLQSERMGDVEAGYRAQWTRTLSFDASAFFSRYHGVLAPDTGPVSLIPQPALIRAVYSLRWGNSMNATDYGGEAALNWAPRSGWRLMAAYSNLHMNGALSPRASPWFRALTEDNAPRHMYQFRSGVNLTRRIEWEQAFLAHPRFAGGPGGWHLRVDSNLNWRAGEHWELGVSGQNLFRPGQVEFADNYWLLPSRNERQILATLSWRQ
ncbi:MAG: TonB-dependent receptor, partial [Acidobacteriota bacterium]|nr:TonB-dependent receptor [Acidobacteriota bacterium]